MYLFLSLPNEEQKNIDVYLTIHPTKVNGKNTVETVSKLFVICLEKGKIPKSGKI